MSESVAPRKRHGFKTILKLLYRQLSALLHFINMSRRHCDTVRSRSILGDHRGGHVAMRHRLPRYSSMRASSRAYTASAHFCRIGLRVFIRLFFETGNRHRIVAHPMGFGVSRGDGVSAGTLLRTGCQAFPRCNAEPAFHCIAEGPPDQRHQ